MKYSLSILFVCNYVNGIWQNSLYVTDFLLVDVFFFNKSSSTDGIMF